MKDLNSIQWSLIKFGVGIFLAVNLWLWMFWSTKFFVGFLLRCLLEGLLLALVVSAAFLVSKRINQRITFSENLLLRHKALRKRLRIKEKTSEEVTNLLMEGIVVIDEQSRIKFANRAARHLLRLPKNFKDVTVATVVREPEFHEIIFSTINERTLIDTTITCLTEQRKLKVRASLLKNGHVLLILYDVTHANTVDELQINFLANASHELRTPVSVILANSELLLEGMECSLGDQSLLTAIHRQSLRAKTLLDSLLDLLRLDARRNPLNLVPVDFHQFIIEIKDSIGYFGNAIKNDILPNTKFITDKDLLARLTLILIENAQKYAGPEPEIKIKAHYVRQGLKLEFSDNGPGIRRHLRERVFERFFRQPEHDQKNIDGFGLGLAQARAIASILNGKIWVEDKNPPGCTIALLLKISDG